MRPGRERRALTGLEVHHLLASPANVPLAMLLEHPLPALAQQGQVDAEAAIGGLGSGDRLEEQVDRRPPVEAGKLRRDVRQAAGLRGDLEVRRSAGRARAGSSRRPRPTRPPG